MQESYLAFFFLTVILMIKYWSCTNISLMQITDKHFIWNQHVRKSDRRIISFTFSSLLFLDSWWMWNVHSITNTHLDKELNMDWWQYQWHPLTIDLMLSDLETHFQNAVEIFHCKNWHNNHHLSSTSNY